MIHGLNNTFLYSAKKISLLITNGKEVVAMRGTGFFVKKNDVLIFVTNRHMVEPGYSNIKLKDYHITDFVIESYQHFDELGKPKELKSCKVNNFSNFKTARNELIDVACLCDIETVPNGMIINAFIDYDMLADRNWYDNKLSVCDSIAYPGFPDGFDKRNNTPIFRMGTIASDPRFDYSFEYENPNIEGAARVAYEGFSSSGASGSPVFAVQKGFKTGDGLVALDDLYREVKLIGINVGHYNVMNKMYVSDSYVNIDGLVEKDASTAYSVSHLGISYFQKSYIIRDMIDSICI